jgi:hypothetical protein
MSLKKGENKIVDIVKDEYFISILKENISELTKDRRERESPKPGYRYKRDYIDVIKDEENLNHTFFIENIEKIWTKNSKLASGVRNFIDYMCTRAFEEAVVRYNEEEETQVE